MIDKKNVRSILKEMEEKNNLNDDQGLDNETENVVDTNIDVEKKIDFDEDNDLIKAIEVVSGVEGDGEFQNPVEVNLKPGDVVTVIDGTEPKIGEVEVTDEGEMEIDFSEEELQELINNYDLYDDSDDEEVPDETENEIVDDSVENNETEEETIEEDSFGLGNDKSNKANYNYGYNYEEQTSDDLDLGIQDEELLLDEDDELKIDNNVEDESVSQTDDNLETETNNTDIENVEELSDEQLDNAGLNDLGQEGGADEMLNSADDELGTSETEAGLEDDGIENGGEVLSSSEDLNDIIVDTLKDEDDLDYLSELGDDLLEEEFNKVVPTKTSKVDPGKIEDKVSITDESKIDVNTIEDEVIEKKETKEKQETFDTVKIDKDSKVPHGTFDKVAKLEREKIINKQFDKLKEEYRKLQFENYKLLKVNGLLTIMPNLTMDAKEQILESFDKCNKPEQVKTLYKKLTNIIAEHKKPNINNIIVEKSNKGVGHILFSESVEDSVVNEDSEKQRRIDYLSGVSKTDEYYNF